MVLSNALDQLCIYCLCSQSEINDLPLARAVSTVVTALPEL